MITLRKRSADALTQAFCGPEDRVGQAVRIVGVELGGVSVTPVNPADPQQMPAYGLIVEKLTATRCVVRRWGDVQLPGDGLEPGKVCYVAPDATITTTPPSADAVSTGIYVLQTVGHATGASSVDFSPSPTTLEIGL